jgi:hypothetical protein
MSLEIVDVAPGVWVWRQRYPDWRPEAGWEPVVSSTCVESGGEIAVIDPLVPETGAEALWERLDARPPTLAVVLKPDHVRDVDAVVRRYGCPAFGPWLLWPHNVPETELQGMQPGDLLPGGFVALHDGRGRGETPLFAPDARALVFADGLTAQGDGTLRVWGTPWHAKRVLPALRDLLSLPFEVVVVSHGAPVHDRAAFVRALHLAPWGG